MAGPLDGVVVLDLGQIYNGPYCTMLMAYLGARVIKIEPLEGEYTRRRPTRLGPGFTPPFIMLNSSKESVALNLRHEQGRALFKSLVTHVDVIVENFTPGTMDRLGLPYDALRAINPRLVYAQSSGYGSFGPYRDFPAMDVTVQAMSGVLAITGFADSEPVKAGPAVADFAAGTHLLAGVLAALFQRERTGEGERVEVSMHDAVVPTLTSNLAAYFETGMVPPRTGNRHGGLALCPYNVYAAREGYVAIFCLSNAQWAALCDVMGRPDLRTDPGWATNAVRVERMDEVDALIGAWTKGQERDALAARLVPLGVPCAPVKDLDEVAHDPHLRERRMLIDVDHPSAGPMTVLGNPIRIGDAEVDPRPAPHTGEHTRSVLREMLGLDEAALEHLHADGVI